MTYPINHFRQNPIMDKKTKRNIDLTEIIMLSGDINYSIVHLKSGKKILICKTLKVLEEYLKPMEFVRVHRKYLINPYFVKSICRYNQTILMDTGDTIEISRRKFASVKFYFSRMSTIG
ncbi:LytR/AlgR family response regulator transcription factor [Flectobacillus major]|uniref:LytR/AlgR family response regulator transcription factor n=1 Tax=Flectobacillus major TaxID=103 RepID=UPI0006938EB9|nr:LytTR family DNA-binding domain-containing protein [Flectobacillus major]